jgi:GH18 family chitinase
LKYLNVQFFFRNAGQYKKVVDLKQKNPKLKVSIYGLMMDEEIFSGTADKPENRKIFIESVLSFIK